MTYFNEIRAIIEAYENGKFSLYDAEVEIVKIVGANFSIDLLRVVCEA